MPQAPLLSIIIPCYNEEGNIAPLYQRFEHVLATYKAQGVEMLFINDGSSDGTWGEIQKLCTADVSVIGVNFSRNFGHEMALAAGFHNARGERIMIIDADLQDPPELLPELMAKMDEGYDVVCCKRRTRKGETAVKRATAFIYYRLLNALSDIHIPEDTGDFRLMSRRALESLMSLPERVRYTRGLVSWLGFRQTIVEYDRDARFSGETHYTMRKLIHYAVDGITSFSTRPLEMAVWLGVGMMFFSLLLIAYAIISWILGDAVRGWTSLVAIFLFFQAIQWFILGVMGNYLGVIFREIKQRPLYLVDTIINKKA
ncbi:MAG: glycosyltransferase [Alphaproteobacteria bacterium]|nr:glycosyltransferase [Alphaproteobacteria bacterium]